MTKDGHSKNRAKVDPSTSLFLGKVKRKILNLALLGHREVESFIVHLVFTPIGVC